MSRLSKYVPAVTNTQAIIEELLEASFLCDACRIEGNQAISIARNSFLPL
jgi:hypothetical protein